MKMQTLIQMIYPAQCVSCDAPTDDDFGLCGACWSHTEFIDGLACDTCGVPLLGEVGEDPVQCDDCMTIARPWTHGRAALVYAGVGRKLVLGLKHGDRTDLAPAAARWIVQRAGGLIKSDTVFVPVPLHWSRLLRRKYNQAALLAQEIAGLTGCAFCPDALRRTHRTKSLDGLNRDERFSVLADAIAPHPKRQQFIKDKPVVLVDDVMTSGATLATCSEVLLQQGAKDVSIVTLARVAKDT